MTSRRRNRQRNGAQRRVTPDPGPASGSPVETTVNQDLAWLMPQTPPWLEQPADKTA